MVILVQKLDGTFAELETEELNQLKQEYIQHLRREWCRIKGTVHVIGSSPPEIGLYTKEGYLIALLYCSDEQVKEFEKLEGRLIKPIPAHEGRNELGYKVYYPSIR